MGRTWLRSAAVQLAALPISSALAFLAIGLLALFIEMAFRVSTSQDIWFGRVGLVVTLVVHAAVVRYGTGAGGAGGAATLWFVCVALILAARARRNHPGFEWFHDNQIRIGALLGTSFRHAGLSDASFANANLASTNFAEAKLIRTNWNAAHSLEKAWFDARWRDPVLRQILITGRAEGLDLSNRNLMGINLTGARLAKANLAHSDLTGATLANADLRDANFSETQALGASFEGADLTGACLRDWNIDKSTRLSGVRCRYFFLSETENANGHRDRRPHDPDRELAPGDFQKLFTQVQETIELLIRKGVDRASFAQALQSMMELYPETRGAIRSVEQVEDGDLIVRLHAEPDADAIGVEQSFYAALNGPALETRQTRALPPASPADAVLLPTLLEAFLKHLGSLVRTGMANIWCNRELIVGDERQAVIDEQLAQAAVILLLISPDYIDSDSCFKRELPAAWSRRDQAAVIPIAVRPCDWVDLPFEKLHMPRKGEPITLAGNQDAAWLEVVRELRKVIAARNHPR